MFFFVKFSRCYLKKPRLDIPSRTSKSTFKSTETN